MERIQNHRYWNENYGRLLYVVPLKKAENVIVFFKLSKHTTISMNIIMKKIYVSSTLFLEFFTFQGMSWHF